MTETLEPCPFCGFKDIKIDQGVDHFWGGNARQMTSWTMRTLPSAAAASPVLPLRHTRKLWRCGTAAPL